MRPVALASRLLRRQAASEVASGWFRRDLSAASDGCAARRGIRWISALALGFAALALLALLRPIGWPAAAYPPWAEHLRRMEASLAAHDPAAARLEWDAAYSAALRLAEWQGMAAVGEASLRLNGRTGGSDQGRITARGIFQIALTRAQRQGSLDGVLRTAEDFAALGELASARLALRVAQSLAGAHPERYVQARMEALGQRLAAQGLAERNL